MQLPVLSKTWQIATIVSNLTGADFTNQTDLEYQKKVQRLAFGEVCVGSSNGTTGALDGVDRWPSRSALVFGSWFCFKRPGTGAMDVLYYDLTGSSAWKIVHSPGGLFTGGSATVAPTATDQAVLYNDTFHGRDDGGHALPLICHVMVTGDLTCTRLLHYFNGTAYGNVHFEQWDQATPGWVNNWAAVDKNGVGKSTSQQVGNIERWTTEFGGGGTGMMQAWGPSNALAQFTATVESCLSQGIGSVYAQMLPLIMATNKNATTGTFRGAPFRPGMFRNNGYSDHGWHGRPFDFWFAPRAYANGDTVPTDGSKQFVLVGDYADVMMPWNGGAFRMV
jgi:hypothetical protein